MQAYLKTVVVMFCLSFCCLPCFAACPSADLTGDCYVDFRDMAVLASQWLTEGIPDDPGVMVLVPAGSFAYQNNYTSQIFLNAFRIDKFEVTNNFYCQFLNNADPTSLYWDSNMEIARQGTSGSYSYTVYTGKENYPVRSVNWYDANVFATWRGLTYGGTYRLPTEQEWEKAAGWDPALQKLWTYGFQRDSIDSTWCNYNNAYGVSLPVGSFNGIGGKNNAFSYYGCYDMSGNVWEWTSSDYNSSYKVFRGGDWYYDASFVRCTYRNFGTPSYRGNFYGFRLVRDLN